MKIKIIITFLLLGFFSTVKISSQEIRERNTFIILVNTYDQLFVESSFAEIKDLKDMVKNYIENPNKDPYCADKKIVNIKHLGEVQVTKGIVSIQCDRNTSYNMYIKVQNEVEKAFNELRNELAYKTFKVHYKNLSKEKRWAINLAVPKRIPEAEPRYVRNDKWELVPNIRKSTVCY